MQIRDLIPGDILVSVLDPGSPLHMGIGLVLRSPYVHVTLYLGAGQELSADAAGVHIRPVTDRYLVVLRFGGDPGVRRVAASLAPKYVGQWYNYAGGALLGVDALLGKTGKARWFLPMPGARFCSELVSDLYVLAGHDVLPDLENGQTAPADFLAGDLLTVAGFIDQGRS